MRIQDLAIVFLIIILPISIVLAAYTQYQIQTINTQTLYDNKLSSATYDAIRAFQINTGESKLSEMTNSKVRDLEASVSTFKNSIMSTFSLDGYSQDDLNNYIPALVYTLYDGFYIYSPYTNVNYRYDDSGNPKDDNGENIYGLKPYISYSSRYIKGNIDVIITYALDNHVTVQGMINGEYVNKDGYLIDNITYNETTGEVVYNGVQITEEHTKEHIPLTGSGIYSYVKIQGTTYYLDEANERIIARLNENTLTVQCEKSKDSTTYDQYYQLIKNNRLAKDYYIDAYNFTKWFKSTALVNLTYADAYDTVVADNGDVNAQQQVWANNTKIFQFNSTMDYTKNIENELSSFNQHRLAVIRHKIEVNLAIAIANYNNYSGANNVFQMPDLKEDEWDHITHNISLISFLQGLPIGGKIYNGYSVVTNSESEEVVLEQNIYILGYNSSDSKYEYYRIGDHGINDGTVIIDSGNYAENSNNYTSAGRLNLAFRRDLITNGDKSYYYYPMQDYNASYNSIVMQNDVDTYDDIYTYVNGQSYELQVAFYTALGRERAGTYRSWSEYINKTENGLIRSHSGTNNIGSGHSDSTTTWKDLSGNKDGTLNGGTWGSNYLSLDGVDDWVNLGKVNLTDQVTLDATIMAKEIQSGSACILSNYETGGVGIHLYDGKPTFQVYIEGVGYVYLLSSNAVTVNEKIRITGTYDGTTLSLYINGRLEATKTKVGTIGAPNYNTVMAIGCNPKGNDSQTNYANINVYSARIYDRTLTQAEIQSLY